MLEVAVSCFLASVIMLSLFDVVLIINKLASQQMVLLNMTERMQFIHFYLQKQIDEAGDWSCATKQPDKNKKIIDVLSLESAKNRFHIKSLSGANVLLVKKCVLIKGKQQFVPVLFFMADTRRARKRGDHIQSLFMQIDHHPREELVAGLSKFVITVLSDANMVSIRYQLKSINKMINHSQNYYYQSGILMAKPAVDLGLAK